LPKCDSKKAFDNVNHGLHNLVFDDNMDTTLRHGNHENTSDTAEKTMKGKILGWIAAASEVGWRSKENKTKI
jgi:hypothetical protein